MRFKSKLAIFMGVCAIGAVPSLAIAAQPEHPGSLGTGHKPVTPGPSAGLPEKAKAYGKYCQGQSEKHVKGEKGTAFSRCVTAMAKVATGATDSPTEACKGQSKKHVKGEKGTPFSKCVSSAAKLQGDQSS